MVPGGVRVARVRARDFPVGHGRCSDPAFPPEDNVTRGEYDGNFTVTATLDGPPGQHTVKGTVGYQACRAERCLMPAYLDFEIAAVIPGD